MLNKLLILSCLIFLFACKKDKVINYDLNGKAVDSNTGNSIAGATVTLEVQELSGGNFSSSFKTIATTSTDASGNYSFNFDRRNASEYRLRLEKDLHFNQELSINPDHLSAESINIYNFDMPAKAWIQVHIKNINPFNTNDVITYNSQGTLDCSICCGGAPFDLEGISVDSTFICLEEGSAQVSLYGYYIKNSQTGQVTETVTTIPFDTIMVNLHY